MFKPLTELLSQHEIFRGMVSPPAMPLAPPTEFRTSSVPEIPLQAPMPSERLLLVRLHELKPESPELQKRLRVFLRKFGPLWAEGEALEKLITEERKQNLQAQYREIRRAGRKQNALVQQLQQEFADAELALRNSAAHQEAVLVDLRVLGDLEREGKHVGRWVTDSEIEAWNQRVEKAKARVTPANERCAELLQERNQAADALAESQKELERLGNEEIRLRKSIAGEAYIDPEFGLDVLAGV